MLRLLFVPLWLDPMFLILASACVLLLPEDKDSLTGFSGIVPAMPGRNNPLLPSAIALDISRVYDQDGKVDESFVVVEEYKDLLAPNHPESKISLVFTDR